MRNVSLEKNVTREAAKKVMAVFMVFVAAWLIMTLCPAAYASSGQQVAQFAAKAVKYALRFLGVMVAIFGAYELFKGFGEGTPGLIRGGSLLAAGAAMIAAGSSGMIDDLVSGIGSF